MNRPGIQPTLGVAALRTPGWVRACHNRLPSRSIRVSVLVGAIVALSLVDLALTLTYVMEIGLIEDNPVARMVLRAGGPALLVAAKLASLAFTSGVLIWARRRGFAEAGAVVGAIVLLWVMVRWVGYIDASSQLLGSTEELELHGGRAWVTLVEVGTE